MKTDGANPKVLLVPSVLFVYIFVNMLTESGLYGRKGKKHRRKYWNQSIIHCITVSMI